MPPLSPERFQIRLPISHFMTKIGEIVKNEICISRTLPPHIKDTISVQSLCFHREHHKLMFREDAEP